MGVVEVQVERVGGFVHQAHWKDFVFYSDTSTWPGASPIHPTPTALFVSSIGFCATTQVQVFGKHLKVPLDAISCEVTGGVDPSGQPILDMLVAVQSQRPAAEVAAVISNAHAGCYAEQALLRPNSDPIIDLRLNDRQIDLDGFANRGIAHDSSTDDLPVTVRIDNLTGPAHLGTWKNFCFCSDEPPRLGGADRYPIPIAYFCGAVGMSILSDVLRRGHDAGLPETRLSSRTATRFSRTGSVLAGTVSSALDGFDIHLRTESSSWQNEAMAVLAESMASSWVVRALTRPVSVTSRATLNGEPLDIAAYSRRVERHGG